MRSAASTPERFRFFGPTTDAASIWNCRRPRRRECTRQGIRRRHFSKEVESVMPVASEILIEVPPYEVSGPRGAPTIVVLGGISANRHVCGNGVDPSPGWWEGVAGRSRALDPTLYQLIGV